MYYIIIVLRLSAIMPFVGICCQLIPRIDASPYYRYYLIVYRMKNLKITEEYRLWLLLNKTRSAIFKLRHRKVGQYLPPNQAAALVTVWAFDGKITPVELSRQLFLEPHSVSELIVRMQKKGLVDKAKDKNRGNVVRLSITDKGRELCNKVMGEDLIHGIMSSLSGEQQEQLRSCLMALFAASLAELGMENDDLLLP